jgi:hypothetical protein
MIRVPIFIIIILVLLVSCTFETGIPFEESMNAIEGAGYLLSVMNTTDLRCFQGLEKDGSNVVFMQVYCAIEDKIDMMSFAINPNYSPVGDEKLLNVLGLIGFPDSQKVLDFISENENRMNRGEQVVTKIGIWRISASTSESGADVIILVGFRSARFLDEVEQ